MGVTHGLPKEAMPYDYSSLFLPEKVWEDMAEHTNKYAERKQTDKQVEDKNWKKTSAAFSFSLCSAYMSCQMLQCIGPLTPSSECQLLLILWGKGDIKNSLNTSI